jgi:uncharacterized membrane protein (UPF0127 family)
VRRILLLAFVVACSTGPKQQQRDDAIPTAQSKPEPTAMPKVYLATPTGEVAVNVEVVSTPAKIERGLMYREHLPPDDGMLFIMGYENDHTFYMRNTLIPLDMLFITKDMTVAGIVERAEPRTETLRRVGARSLYVLEVNGGWAKAHQVTAGAKVRFDGITP